jgi:hypothetical protein
MQVVGTLALVLISLLAWQRVAGASPTNFSTTVGAGGTKTGPSMADPSEFLGTLCGYTPLSPVIFSVVAESGSAASEGSQIADQTGCVTFDGRISQKHLSVNGSAAAPIGYGINDIIGSGTNGRDAQVYDTLRVPLDRSGNTGVLPGSQMHVADAMALVVAALAAIAFVFILVTLIRHRLARE